MRLRILALLSLFALPTAAMADTVYVYTYTGHPFTIIDDTRVGPPVADTPNSPYSTSDFVTGSFTLAAPLAPNAVGEDANGHLVELHPITFSFTDGVNTVTDANEESGATSFEGFDTDSNGAITAWDVNVSTNSPPDQLQVATSGFFGSGEDLGSINRDFVQFDSLTGENMNTPGTWVVTTEEMTIPTGTGSTVTPEPSSFVLMGTGLLGFVGAVRRRLRP